MIRGVIFDLGNTLMYFDGDWDEVTESGATRLQRFLVSSGLQVSEDFASRFLAVRAEGRKRSQETNIEFTAEQALRQALREEGVGDIDQTFIATALELFFADEEMHWKPYPDAQETLRSLQAKGLRLGLASNATDHKFIERIAMNAGLASFFDPLTTSAGTSIRKPDPRALTALVEYWGLKPDHVLMVGDYPSFDILGAHRAGMKGVLVVDRWDAPILPHGEFADAYLIEPDAAISQLAELPDILTRMNGSQTLD